MEYYILNNQDKQGPFDLISMIKKVKNGSLSKNSQISTQFDGPFQEASSFDELASVLEEHSNPSAGNIQTGNMQMTLKASFLEGIELWMRHVIDYTIIVGLIIASGYGVQSALRSLTTADSMFPQYISTTLMMALFFEFFYYALETKRSQEVKIKSFIAVMKRTLPSFIALSAILSLFVLAYGISSIMGLAATSAVMLVITLIIFTPFIVTDSNISVSSSAKLSIQKVKSMGADNFGVILAIVAINLFATIIPGLIVRDLFGLGLFVSLPVTISALAYIYDQVFV